MATISARVQSLISEQIISGKLRPGTRLDERQLAEEFNVSRTPVREALRQLAARGLTQILPMRGAIVMQISIKELSELLHADCELEALCARLAAESMTTMEKSELEYIHQRTKALVGENDIEAYLEANREFHRVIIEGSHNQVLTQMVSDIRERLNPYRQYQPTDQDRLTSSHASHDAIVGAVLAGNGEAAYLAMRGHNAHLGNAALRALRQASEATEQADRAPAPTSGRARAGAAPSRKATPAADSRPAPEAKAQRKSASA
ncbi:GntR family transcriptional regulator [Pseudorhodoferax sp.]|uniref:GntR family transcriptional regulator n=1 Tax=Pseudorhodoferax sp. TaxID=1993553 RepID=UPI002DD62884|nr:FCD domain-containing protein [Pseudorhodoferax sp.]